MAKAFLIAYLIGITVFTSWSFWIGLCAVLAMEQTSWRTWADLLRTVGTLWLFFAIPAFVLYALLILLPRALENRINRKHREHEQALLQERARSLNPPAANAPLSTAPTPTAACTSPASAPSLSTPFVASATPASSLPVSAHLNSVSFSSAPVASSVLWRVLVTFIALPLLCCALFTLKELLTAPTGSPAYNFTEHLLWVLLVSSLLSLFPLLAYWLLSELLLSCRPRWFASRLRHCAIGAILALALTWFAIQLDPFLTEETPEFLGQPQVLLFASGAGVALALLYRLPIQWHANFDDPP